jgi:translation initiation factor 2 subunit 3
MDIKIDTIDIPSVVICTLGHVANGKTTITKKLTGESTLRSDTEIKTGGKTLKLGYANGKIFKCNTCDEPLCYSSGSYTLKEKQCNYCSGKTTLIKTYSIMDCPGHNSLMSLVTSGTCIVDYTILVESYPDLSKDYIFPSPQTIEHYNVSNISKISNIATILNKIDLCTENNNKKIETISNFVNILNNKIETTHKLVIPMAAVYNINLDVLCQKIAETKDPIRDIESQPLLIVSRSFDINKPQKINKDTILKGGTVGGALLRGVINIGDTLLIYPGYVKLIKKEYVEIKHKKKKEVKRLEYNVFQYCPIETNVSSIQSGTQPIKYAVPGGLIALQLDIDPSMTKGDRATGTVITTPNNNDIKVSNMILFQVVTIFPETDGKIKNITFINGTSIDIHINSTTITGKIFKYNKKKLQCRVFLDKPIVIYPNVKIVISEHKNNQYCSQDGERNNDSGKNIALCSIIDCEICQKI